MSLEPADGNPAPYRCKHNCERDELMDRIADLTADRQALILYTRRKPAMTDRTEALREEIARVAAPMMEGGREFDQCPPDRIALRKWNREGMCSINDATQDDALTLADAILPIITRERERAARAALEAAGKE